MSDEAEPRTRHHYVLAHVALRGAAKGNPLGFFAVMGGPRRQDFLDDLWKRVCENCDEEGRASFTSKDLKIVTALFGLYPAVVIQMPKPLFVAEAHMVCIVLMVPLSKLSGKPVDPQLRYFTLEAGTNESGTDRTVLCSWDGEAHVNYGDGPEPTVPDFVEAVGKLIGQKAT